MKRIRILSGGGTGFLLTLFGMVCTAQGGLVHHLLFQDAAGNGTLQNFGSYGGTATIDANNVGYYTNDVPPNINSTWAWYAAEQEAIHEAYLALGDDTPPPLLTSKDNEISVLIWIKLDDLDGFAFPRGILSYRQHGGNGWGMWVRDHTGNDNYKLYLEMRDSDDNLYTFATTGTVPEGVWTQIAWTWTAGGGTAALKLYINGELAPFTGTIPEDAVLNTYTRLRASVHQWNTAGRQLIGAIDDLRLYDEVLTQQQIQDIMKPPLSTVIMIR